jgi:hypothetical protein
MADRNPHIWRTIPMTNPDGSPGVFRLKAARVIDADTLAALLEMAELAAKAYWSEDPPRRDRRETDRE